MSRRLQLCAGVAALGILAAAPAANAAVVQVLTSAQLSSTPLVVTLGTGIFSFTADNSGFFPMSSIATAGTGTVSTFFGGVTDFSSGAPIDGSGLYSFASYSTPTSIPTSAAMDYVGLAFTGVGGIQYGYAEVFGSTLVGYAYETAANTTITTQDIQSSTAVPEPASAALLIGGLAVGGLVRRNRKGRGSLAA